MHKVMRAIPRVVALGIPNKRSIYVTQGGESLATGPRGREEPRVTALPAKGLEKHGSTGEKANQAGKLFLIATLESDMVAGT